MAKRELFDFLKLQDEFRAAKTPENEILLEEYATAFIDIAGFFDLLGTAFGFVAKDLRAMVKILRAHRAEDPEHYATLQSMVAHEVSAGLTRAKPSKSGLVNGSRTVLRMHRTLNFVTRFLDRIKSMPDEGYTSTAASEEYKATLARHEPWLVQKVALLAIKTLPIRKVFLERNVKQPKEELEAMADTAIGLMREVVDITQTLFEKNDLLDLP
ncbi:ceramide-1-phosphate transfer protein-like [Patiria miniata]|uniref:Glycolipid transfer protein domain-containing protein n=1 Tax=Patiria miniata TaxID=46514 RepID=A0A913ZPE4_PATMI|nr:ceramide-1-phosphate transfer protein-like [Patiria miniata]